MWVSSKHLILCDNSPFNSQSQLLDETHASTPPSIFFICPIPSSHKRGGFGMDGENPNEVYRECLRNHAASLGSYATDGCGEFTVSETPSGSAASGLQCAACGCHRNFHRKLVSYKGVSSSSPDSDMALQLIDYGTPTAVQPLVVVDSETASGVKKRFRTKFSAEQKQKMLAFADKLGWKLQRKDLDHEVESFCSALGVSRQVFKVWMHNHKNSSSSSSNSASTPNASSLTQ